jgi:hypothetical protein
MLTRDSCCAQCEFAFEDGHVRFYLAPKLSEVSSSHSRLFPSPLPFSSLLSRVESLADPCCTGRRVKPLSRLFLPSSPSQPSSFTHVLPLVLAPLRSRSQASFFHRDAKPRERRRDYEAKRRRARGRGEEGETGHSDCCTESSAMTGGGEEDVHQGAGASTPRTL